MRLPRQLPLKIATELVLTGEMYPASVLAAHGLINQVVASGEALQTALGLARSIAANGPMAVAVSKRVLNESIDWQSGELFERQNEITTPVFVSADAREGATAFAEKRKPVWRGV